MSEKNCDWYEELVGLRIEQALQAINIHSGDLEIYLVFLDGRIVRLCPEGDCCAHAYIAQVNNPEALLIATIISIEDLEHSYERIDEIRNAEDGGRGVGDSENPDDDDDHAFDIWGHRINTDRGTCVIDCRTSHNGYYSGWLNVAWVDEVPEGAIPLQEK